MSDPLYVSSLIAGLFVLAFVVVIIHLRQGATDECPRCGNQLVPGGGKCFTCTVNDGLSRKLSAAGIGDVLYPIDENRRQYPWREVRDAETGEIWREVMFTADCRPTGVESAVCARSGLPFYDCPCYRPTQLGLQYREFFCPDPKRPDGFHEPIFCARPDIDYEEPETDEPKTS